MEKKKIKHVVLKGDNAVPRIVAGYSEFTYIHPESKQCRFLTRLTGLIVIKVISFITIYDHVINSCIAVHRQRGELFPSLFDRKTKITQNAWIHMQHHFSDKTSKSPQDSYFF